LWRKSSSEGVWGERVARGRGNVYTVVFVEVIGRRVAIVGTKELNIDGRTGVVRHGNVMRLRGFTVYIDIDGDLDGVGGFLDFCATTEITL